MVFVIILIATIIFINYIWSGDKDKNNSQKSNQNTILAENDNQIINNNDINVSNNIVDNSNNSLEKQLEDILKNLEGVEDVNVLITYSETNKIVPMYNEDINQSTTQEEDNQGRC